MNKTVASILVIIGSLLIISGILINQFVPKKENEEQSNHLKEEAKYCDIVHYEEKHDFLVINYSGEDWKAEYDLLTTDEDLYEKINDFEYDPEFTQFDFQLYDYFIYYYNNEKFCSQGAYLTNYSINNNNLNIEITKTEINKEICDNKTIYGFIIQFNKGILTENIEVNTTIKEDPYKECYNK